MGVYLVKPHSIRDLERAIAVAMARFKDMIELSRLHTELKARDKEQRRATQLELVSGIIQKTSSILYQEEMFFQVAHLIRDAFGYHSVRIRLVEDDSHIGRELDGPLSSDDQDARYKLAVRIKRNGHNIGVLDVRNRKPNVLSEHDVFIVQTLADQLAIAIENAQTYQQTDQYLQARVKELALLQAITRAINRTHDFDAILRLILDSVIELFEMDAGGIMLLDGSTNRLSVRQFCGHSLQFIQAMGGTRVDEGLMPRMLESVLVIDDLSQLQQRHRLPIEAEGLQCLVSIPIRAQKSALGVMVICSHSHRALDPQELALCAAIGNQLGVVVERTNLQVQELRAAVLEERQAMAWQMHDDLAQTLGYLGLQIDSLMTHFSLSQNAEVQDDLEEIRSVIDGAYQRVCSSIVRLREDTPQKFDLRTTLLDRIDKFRKQTGCQVESQLDEAYVSCLSPSAAFQVSYIVHEALTNVRKHSGADFVRLSLQSLESDMVEIVIQDNGQGFDPDRNQPLDREGFGLRFMQERAERVGGRLEIVSHPDHGTQIVIRLPVSD
jgi:two-component system nitrate/nitrite sensor histidine kinase NarX